MVVVVVVVVVGAFVVEVVVVVVGAFVVVVVVVGAFVLVIVGGLVSVTIRLEGLTGSFVEKKVAVEVGLNLIVEEDEAIFTASDWVVRYGFQVDLIVVVDVRGRVVLVVKAGSYWNGALFFNSMICVTGRYVCEGMGFFALEGYTTRVGFAVSGAGGWVSLGRDVVNAFVGCAVVVVVVDVVGLGVLTVVVF